MESSEYKPLGQDQDDSESTKELEVFPSESYVSKKLVLVLVIALTSSFILNAVLIFQNFHKSLSESPTEFASVLRDQPVGFTHISPFISTDLTIQAAAWHDPSINPELGLVAIPESVASAKGLPESQVWPWDTSKRIYLLNGFHSMHCIHAMRVTINQAYKGLEPSLPQSHMMHCIDVLREETMCAADDTPRYTGRVNSEVGKEVATSGNGQKRMCRDWGTLADWAKENSACYRYVNKTDPDFPEIDRYKYCPDGRVLW